MEFRIAVCANDTTVKSYMEQCFKTGFCLVHSSDISDQMLEELMPDALIVEEDHYTSARSIINRYVDNYGLKGVMPIIVLIQESEFEARFDRYANEKHILDVVSFPFYRESFPLKVRKWIEIGKRRAEKNLADISSYGVKKHPTDKSVPLLIFVEDEADDKAAIEYFLDDRYETLFLQSKEEALKWFAEPTNPVPSMIGLDIFIDGEMSGFEVFSWLRSEPRFNDVPVVFTSSQSDGNLINQCLEHGAADFIIKPYNSGLRSKVSRIVNLYSELS